MDLTHQSAEQLAATAAAVQETYDRLRGRNLALDMTRGKPAADQLDLTDEMLNIVHPGETEGVGGDYRNYGLLAGIPEARAFFADYMGTSPDEVVICGNSSLNLMYDAVAGAMLFGVAGGSGPWKDQTPIKFICPVPGYDRHFAICERLGIAMVTVDMTDTGPDMDAVEALVVEDASIKGMWCVPKYSNPSGEIYSDETVDRLAAMPTAADDFRIIWDNAYAVHHLGDGPADVKNLLAACKAAGTADRAWMVGSTSKITYAGAGVAVFAASEANVADALKKLFYASIGFDKINQLRHVRFFGDMDGLLAHMDKQAALIAPKFAAVDAALEAHLSGKGIATWKKPKGGYFVSVDVLDGCAAEVIRLAGEAGVKLTPAGSTWPQGKDPNDRNIRLAPTFPTVAEVEQAMEVVCACIEKACLAKLQADDA